MILPQPPAAPPGFSTFEDLMALALEEAKTAGLAGEVPVGAVLVDAAGKVLARAGNSVISRQDPTAHAEMLCIRQAAERIGNYRLDGAVLAVTLEPCVMCLGAVIHARLAGLAYATPDPKTGAIRSQLDGPGLSFFNHRFWVQEGSLGQESAVLLRNFFQARR